VNSFVNMELKLEARVS